MGDKPNYCVQPTRTSRAADASRQPASSPSRTVVKPMVYRGGGRGRGGRVSFLVRPLFHNPAVLQHHDLIRCHDGAQPVGDHEGRASL